MAHSPKEWRKEGPLCAEVSPTMVVYPECDRCTHGGIPGCDRCVYTGRYTRVGIAQYIGRYTRVGIAQYASLYTPGYIYHPMYTPPSIHPRVHHGIHRTSASPGATSALDEVYGEEALGSTGRITLGERHREVSQPPKV